MQGSGLLDISACFERSCSTSEDFSFWFRGEYEKLFNTLEKSNRNEKRLKTKCKALVSEISQHVSQVDLAHEQSKVKSDVLFLFFN